MIRYALGCAEGHAFDSWFPDSAAYDKQRERGLVACPECGSTRVDKAIMAPAVVGAARACALERAARGARSTTRRRRQAPRAWCSDLRGARSRRTPTTSAQSFRRSPRAIHHGDEPERAIRGQASLRGSQGADRGRRRRAADAHARRRTELSAYVLLRRQPELRRLDHGRADHRPGRNPEGDQHVVALDRRQPDFEVLVFGHEFGRWAVAAVAGDRHVANGADDDWPVVALGLYARWPT